DHAGTAHGSRRLLEEPQALLLRDAGLDPGEDPHGVALLKAVQCARRGIRLDSRERRDGHELAARRADLQIEQRRERRAVLVADLRDDLVAPVEVVEAVDVSAAEQRAELLPYRREIQPQVRDALAVEHDARLRLIELQIRVDEQELAALPTRRDHLRGGLEQLLERRV